MVEVITNQNRVVSPERLLFGGFAIMALNIALYFYASGDSTGFGWFWFLAGVQFSSLLFDLVRRQAAFISTVCVAHAFCYTLGKYNNVVQLRREKVLSASAIGEMQQIALCTILIVVAFFIFRSLLPPRDNDDKPWRKLELLPRQFFIAQAFLVLFYPMGSFVPPALTAVYTLIPFGCFAILFCARCPNLPLIELVGKVVVAIFAAISYVMDASLASIVLCIFILFVQYMATRRVLGLLWVGVLVYAVTHLNATKAVYRSFVWTGAAASSSLVERATILSGILSEYFASSDLSRPQELDLENDTPDSVATSFDRISDESLERVLTLTPSPVPFWGGVTYEPLAFSLIPRFIWPDKPKRNWANRFGQAYGFLSDGDEVTSIACSFLAEGYMNFGFVGLYGVAIFFGCMVALAENAVFRLFGCALAVGYVAFLVPFLSYASDLAPMVQMPIYMMVALYPFRAYMRRFIPQI